MIFTPCKVEQPLHEMELNKRATKMKIYRKVVKKETRDK